MAIKCTACFVEITDGLFLTCSLCEGKYDLLCVNVSEKIFYLMDRERKLYWKCPKCKSNQRKLDNTDTPVRDQGDLCTERNNVTVRRKITTVQNEGDSLLLDDTLPGGDTIEATCSHNISEAILMELKQLRMQMSDQATKQEARDRELTDTIKLMQTCILNITNQNTSLASELKTLRMTTENNAKRIDDLEKENLKLRQELNQTIQEKIYTDEKNTSTEYELHERVLNVFYDIAGVDLTGYIEEISRLGKRGNRRPLKIELLSKKITKHLISSVQYFKNTGLWLSTFLDEKGLQKRKQERDDYRKANQYIQRHTKNQTTKEINTTMENTNTETRTQIDCHPKSSRTATVATGTRSFRR
ncbi:hypothetical protein ABMA27_012865 [Loxostege sticticalis]|uniref:PHD-type domain-containing protein n=1 Tax=Loxostege sticticalis TaxID=481309 RepID=A0ABR3H023_LOXSC